MKYLNFQMKTQDRVYSSGVLCKTKYMGKFLLFIIFFYL